MKIGMNDIAKAYWVRSWRRVRTGEGRFLASIMEPERRWSEVYIEQARKCHMHRHDYNRRSMRLSLAVLRNDKKTGRRLISQQMVSQFYDGLLADDMDNVWNRTFMIRGAEA